MKQNIILLAGLLCLASCTSKDDKAQQDTYKALRNEVVETTPVEMRAYGDELTLNGDVSCDEAIQKIAAALGVTTDYFMDDATFQQELNDDLFYADVRKKYGSRGVAQAKKIKEQTTALFAGGELSEEDQAAFIKEMEALFLDAKEDAKKFTPKKYL